MSNLLQDYGISHSVKKVLTPKIPTFFLAIFAISNLFGGIHFSTQKSMGT
jgi:hypothetical protein